MTNQTVTLDTKVVEKIVEVLELHWSPRPSHVAIDCATRIEVITTLRAALANAERVEPVPTRIERKVYKNSAEHSEYLSARFTKDKQADSFEWQGHRWAYHWTSFDDEGDFDLIYRNTSPKDRP